MRVREAVGIPGIGLVVVLGALSACGPKGQVTIRGPEATDDAPQEWVEAFTEAMDNNQPRFVTCYEDVLKEDAAVQGTVTVQIELGAPSFPSARANTTGSDVLADCVIESSPSKIYLHSAPDGNLTFELDFAPK
ncbi:MAG: hypothetical protein QGH45_25610 [Myxococcota bacterium]|jgi:hypothetical protein|nr:hypothetical protein [Myxococcota bacterium]